MLPDTLASCPGNATKHIDFQGVEIHPRSADAALKSLTSVTERLERLRDIRAAFPDVYAVITRAVAEAVERPGFFLEPAWMSRLSGRFCERYLQTLLSSLDGRPQDCGAWGISYRHPAEHPTAPIQAVAFALNAHINYDLAIGIYQNITELGGADDRLMARYKRDHDAVNLLLEASIPESIERLTCRHGCGVTTALSKWLPGPTGWLIMATLRRWRAQVWVGVEALLAATHEAERRAIIRRMDARATRIGLTMAMPGGSRRTHRVAS